MLLRPKIDKLYFFVRVIRGEVEVAKFRRGAAGDAYCVTHICELDSPEGDPDGWRGILTYLQQQGFVELSEARASGVMPPDWHPDAEPLS